MTAKGSARAEPTSPDFNPRLVASLRQPRRCPSDFSEHIYKTVKGHELQLRIWPAKNLAAGKKAPWVVWTHGGGWASGNHLAPPQWYRRGFIERGHHLVTHAYRLTPQAGIEEMLEDCLDAVAWARNHLGGIVGEDKVDIEKLVITGDSAGGHLCTLLAHHLSPPPKVVLAIYPVTNLEVIVTKDLPKPEDWKGRWPEDELQAAIKNREEYCSIALFEKEHHRFPVEEVMGRWQAPWLKYDERRLLQSSLMDYLAVKGLLLTTALRQDSYENKEDFIAFAKSVSPSHLLDDRGTYPPTAILTGTGDYLADFVLQSRDFGEKLRGMGVDVLESYQPGGPHVFDQVYHDESVEGWSEYIEPVLQFVQRHVA